MRKKIGLLFYPLIVMGSLLVVTISCTKSGSKTDPTPTSTTITDGDGNVYHAVQIGVQTWMLENLKTTKYRNGDPIPNVTNGTSWVNLTTGAYCNYNNDANNGATYGRLYNWFAVYDSRKIAPAGWHIPTAAEWATLASYLLGKGGAGARLKEAGTTHWASPNTGASNSSGFTALPGGQRVDDGTFFQIGVQGCWWISDQVWGQYMFSSDIILHDDAFPQICGLSVRCIKD